MPPLWSPLLRVKGIQEGEDNVTPTDNLLPFPGIPHDPGMETESGKGLSGELTPAALS